MRIYNRSDFLKLPSGTLYFEVAGEECCTDHMPLRIKLENNEEGDDFLHTLVAPDSHQVLLANKQKYLLVQSEELDLIGGWDKMYKEDVYYVALEASDWKNIKDIVDKAYE